MSRWLLQVVGVWHASQRAPSSPRWASLWQSAQAVPTCVKTSVRWHERQDARACACWSGKPVVSWRNVGVFTTGTQLCRVVALAAVDLEIPVRHLALVLTAQDQDRRGSCHRGNDDEESASHVRPPLGR